MPRVTSTIAGNGTAGYTGEGIIADTTEIDYPKGIVVKPAGIFFSEQFRIRHINPAGIITTSAGTGVPGYSGDGGAATLAALNDVFT